MMILSIISYGFIDNYDNNLVAVIAEDLRADKIS